MPKVHYLKTWPRYFEAVQSGDKTFEIRQNDRDYQIGDTLVLQCWSPETKTYDGREERRYITYMLSEPVVFQDIECVILGIRELP